MATINLTKEQLKEEKALLEKELWDINEQFNKLMDDEEYELAKECAEKADALNKIYEEIEAKLEQGEDPEKELINEIIEYLRTTKLTDTEFTRRDYAKECRISKKTAIEHISKLKSRDLIRITRKRGQTEYYKLNSLAELI